MKKLPPSNIFILQHLGLGIAGSALASHFPLDFMTNEEKLILQEMRQYESDYSCYSEMQRKYGNVTEAEIKQKIELLSVGQKRFK
jgi:hypothetical protein